MGDSGQPNTGQSREPGHDAQLYSRSALWERLAPSRSSCAGPSFGKRPCRPLAGIPASCTFSAAPAPSVGLPLARACPRSPTSRVFPRDMQPHQAHSHCPRLEKPSTITVAHCQQTRGWISRNQRRTQGPSVRNVPGEHAWWAQAPACLSNPVVQGLRPGLYQKHGSPANTDPRSFCSFTFYSPVRKQWPQASAWGYRRAGALPHPFRRRVWGCLGQRA